MTLLININLTHFDETYSINDMGYCVCSILYVSNSGWIAKSKTILTNAGTYCLPWTLQSDDIVEVHQVIAAIMPTSSRLLAVPSVSGLAYSCTYKFRSESGKGGGTSNCELELRISSIVSVVIDRTLYSRI